MKEETSISETVLKKIKALAEKGDIPSLSAYSKMVYRINFNNARKAFLECGEVSEETLTLINSYIESGCSVSLNPGEELYLEILTLMNSMRRKYGRVNTIKFFQGSPFNLSYAKARSMYDESINLFYSDLMIEKKALRNLKAQQLEDAAEMVLAVAKEPKDFEIYERLISASSKIRQLDQPDPDPVAPNTYNRPYKFYTLDPERIGISRPNRLEIAKQIDSIVEATESEKRRARMDSGIENVDFKDILNEHEEES